MFAVRERISGMLPVPITGWLDGAVSQLMMAFLSAGVQPEWCAERTLGGRDLYENIGYRIDDVDVYALTEWLALHAQTIASACVQLHSDQLWLYVGHVVRHQAMSPQEVHRNKALLRVMTHVVPAARVPYISQEMASRLAQRRAQRHALWSPLTHGAYPRPSRAAIIALLVLHAHGPAALRRLDGWLLHRLLSAVAATFRQYY